MINPPPPQRAVPRRHPDALVYGLTERQLRRAQSEGRLSTVKPSGPTGPALVIPDEIGRLLKAATTGPTRGPLAGHGGDLDGLDHAALCALAEQIDARLWGDER